MYTTALVMIARNEARCIARSLRSMRPWVDQMIVLDTGSTDDTAAIARTEGAQVHHFEWVNDFAAARNAALAACDADWRIVVDADEVLQDSGEALAHLRQTIPTFIGRIEVRSAYQGAAGTALHYTSSWLPRILPTGILYEGRVHEQPISSLPRLNLPVQLKHDGYLPEHMRIKGDRNRLLLEAALHAAPNDAYLHYQLGKDHEVHDRFELACVAYAQARELLCPDTARLPSWRHDLVLRSLYVLKASDQLHQAVHLAESEMPNWPDSPDYYFVLGDVLLDFAATNPQQAHVLIPMIRSAWERCLEIGENPSLEGAVHGRGSVLARHNLDALQKTFG